MDTQLGRFGEAGDRYTRAMEYDEAHSGSIPGSEFYSMHNLAGIRAMNGDYAGALELYPRSHSAERSLCSALAGGRAPDSAPVSAHSPRPDTVAYTATKHAMTGLTKSIALDGRRHDIACSQIDIGNAMTEMAARMASGVPQADGEIRAEPLMDVQVVAETILYMAGLDLSANAQTVTIMATKMPFVGRG